MSRPQRLNFKDACYLVTLQGADGVGLFVEKADARHFETLLERLAAKHKVIVHAYGLAANSGQLVLQTPEANLSGFMQGVQTAFARHIRYYYVQSGSIMKDRYKAKVLELPGMLSAACAWVHSYPARDNEDLRTPAQRQRFLERHPYSSYRQTVGLREKGLAHPAHCLRGYGSPAGSRPAKHREHCRAMLTEADPEWNRLLTASQVAVGSDAFVEAMEKQHTDLRKGRKVKGLQRHGVQRKGVSRTKVFQAVAKAFGVSKEAFGKQTHGSSLRPALSYCLYRYSKMSQQEIADFLKLGSAAAVSLQMTRLIKRRQEDPKLDKTLLSLEKQFTRGSR